MWDNYGQIHNYGLELQLNGVLIEKKDLKWDMSFNASWNRNMVVRITGDKYGQEGVETYMDLGGVGGDGLTGVNTMRLAEGQPIGNYYGFRAAGLDDKGAMWYYKADGSLTKAPKESDKTYIGNAQPYVNFGLNTTLRYKWLDFGLNFRGQIGGTYFNETRFFYEQTRGVENCLLSAWNKTDGTGAPNFTRVMSDYYLEDASYLKLNDLTIGYTPTLPEEFSKWINYIRISFTAQNLFTITGYKGHDPASVNLSGLTPGFDGRSYYPTQRTFNLGVQFRF
jgi:iron complex outermembrane receptor protein